MKRQTVLLAHLCLLAALVLTGCQGGPSPTPTSTAGKEVSQRALESALATRFVNDPTGLCEWEVWGEAGQEIYLWAICQSAEGAGCSAPAVVCVTQDEGGVWHIQEVEMPRDGTLYGEDVRVLFPPDVQTRISAHDFDAKAAWARIEARRDRINRQAIQVTLGIFSGRPDPTWTLTPAQTIELRQRLEALPPTDQPFDDVEWFPSGYHGLTLLLPAAEGQPSQLVKVYKGIVLVETEGQVTRLADVDQDLERWLLTGGSGDVWSEFVGTILDELDQVAGTPSPAETVTATPAPTETPTPPPLNLADAEIAYLDIEHHLWVMNADGTAHRQLTQSGAVRSPTWSPDGQTLTYVYAEGENGPWQVMLYDLSRQQAQPLKLDISDGWVHRTLGQAMWSPDGRYLLLDYGTSPARGLILVEVASGRVVQEFGTEGGHAWSPESDAVVIGQRRPLDEPISVECGDAASLAVLEVGAAEPQVLLEGSAEVLYSPRAWLPDGRILYNRGDWDEAAQSGDESLWTITWEDGQVGEPQPADDLPLRYDCDTVREHIKETVNVPVTGFIGFISWAPDNRHLVFQTGTYPNYGIYLLDWESDDPPRCLADGISPTWRPAPRVTATPAILDVYPLAVGTTWVYSVTLDEDNIGHWTGLVTETVTSVEQQGKELIFRAELDTQHPLLVQPRERVRYYVALDDRLYRLASQQNSSAVIAHDGEGNESAQILTWPLETGQRWGEPEMMARGDSGYVWEVMAQDPVTTPAGAFEDCYRVRYVANTGYEQRWFCPGTGIVRSDYHHNGSLFDEVWELQTTNAQQVLRLRWEDVLIPLTPAQAVSSYYQPVVEPRAAVAALLADGLRWLNAGGEPADLAAALNAPVGESADAITVMERDVTGDGREDVLLHSTFMGVPLLVFVNRGGSPARFAGYALPTDFAETIANGWSMDFGMDGLGTEQPALQVTDLTGDGVPEILLSYLFAGGSNFRVHPRAYQWNTGGFRLIFAAELVRWAGFSTLALEPDPAGGQVIRLSYPIFLPGRYPKAGPNPQGEQFWRWDAKTGRYHLAWQTVGPYSEGPVELGAAERAFVSGDYLAALRLYEAFLANEAWQQNYQDSYGSAWPDSVGPRELAAWLDLARLHRGLCLALTGQAEDARTALAGVETTESLAELAQVFLDTYDDPAGDLLAGLAAYERRLAAGPEDVLSGGLDRPAAVYRAFTVQTALVHTALTQVGPSELAATLAAYDAPVADLRVSDLDEDGAAEVVWLSPPSWHAYAPNETPVGNWQQAWVAWQDGNRWQMTGIAAADRITLLGVTPPDARRQRGIQLRLIDTDQTQQVALFWDGEVQRPYAPVQQPGWPTVGWPES